MKPNKIGIFDSGVGSLFVLKELFDKYPLSEYLVYIDNKNMPYGNKTKKELYSYGESAIKYLEKNNVDIIICACGTISSTVLEKLKKKFSTKIISILEPTTNYINVNNIKNVLVISTNNTCKSNYFQNHIKNCKTIGITNLAYMIENSIDYKEYLNNILSCYKKYNYIVLGCTHYPIISEYLEKKYSYIIINMGLILANSIIVYPSDSTDKINLYFTKKYNNFKLINDILKKRKYKICQNLQK